MTIDERIVSFGDRLPLALATRAFAAVIGDARVALCLHRIGESTNPRTRANICRPETIDALVAALVGTRRDAKRPWLTVSFDDGYLDAIEYVRSRAPRFPQVEWIVFVCPEKTERQVGFRWDVPGAAPDAEKADMDIDAENARPDLLLAGRDAATRVATVAEVESLRAVPNAAIGNHTNTHALQTRLSHAEAEREYARSIHDFVRLFGPQTQFAFPFGTPHHQVTETHVRMLWRHGDFDIWTTERRPYSDRERRAGAPLPRFSPDGRWGAAGVMLWMAAHALRHRLRPARTGFGPTLVRRDESDGAAVVPHSTAAGRIRERA